MASDLKVGLAAVELADRIALSMFRQGSLRVETKADQSPVTAADRAAEAAVREYIGGERPEDAVLGEEMGTTGSGPRRWLIDPIDGTANYVRGIPVWATLLALEVDGGIEVGVVSAPALGRRWWACRGDGAFAASPGETASRLEVSSVKELAQGTISCGGLGYFARRDKVAELLARAKRDRGFGDFWQHMLVAEGALEVALDPVVSIWDIAALQVIVEEAGGKFTDLAGARRLDAGNAVSSNGFLHGEVVDALAYEPKIPE